MELFSLILSTFSLVYVPFYSLPFLSPLIAHSSGLSLFLNWAAEVCTCVLPFASARRKMKKKREEWKMSLNVQTMLTRPLLVYSRVTLSRHVLKCHLPTFRFKAEHLPTPSHPVRSPDDSVFDCVTYVSSGRNPTKFQGPRRFCLRPEGPSHSEESLTNSHYLLADLWSLFIPFFTFFVIVPLC